MAKGNAVLKPNLGLYLDRPPLEIPARGLVACQNVRIKNRRIVRDNMGWSAFLDDPLDTPVVLIDNFYPSGGGQKLIIGTTRDLYEYDETTETLLILTPRYAAGTVAVETDSKTVTGSSTSWAANAKAGDFIRVTSTAARDPYPVSDWYEIESVGGDEAITLVEEYQGATASGLAYAIRQTYTATMLDVWRTETFIAAAEVDGDDGDRWYATNGVDFPVSWNGIATAVSSRADLGFRCKDIRRYKNQMHYIALVESGTSKPFSVRVSAIGEPENVTTKEAAEYRVHDGVDPLLAAELLGDNILYYAERSVTMAQFVGGEVGYIFRTAISGIGPVSARAIADFGDFHEFIGVDSKYRFDGVQLLQSDTHVWLEILRKQRPNALNLLHAHFDEENGEILWVVPLTTDGTGEDGAPATAYVQHYTEDVGDENPDAYTLRTLPALVMGYFGRETTLTFDQISESWAEQNYRWDDRFFQAAFPFNLFGTADGMVHILNETDSFDGEPIESFARFGRRPCIDGRRKGLVKRIYPFAERLAGAEHDLTVELYLANEAGAPATLASSLPYNLKQDDPDRFFVSPFVTGRYYQIGYRTTGAGKGFTLQGHDADIDPAGGR